ncbi:hypothetical protein [Aeromicrobium sp. 179-A 4D2 NHS]|uniref:hypothetical protein n=1 Tax=Aeromicrobium sp. 179-A 4D2 NHS TaxID=3142375 RepID=UPI0039A04D4A
MLEAASNLFGIVLAAWMGHYLIREWRLWRAERTRRLPSRISDADYDAIYAHLQATYDQAMRLRDRLATDFEIHIREDDQQWPGVVADLRHGHRVTLGGIDQDSGERVHTHLFIRDGVLHLESD